jgi:hypothetical protein
MDPIYTRKRRFANMPPQSDRDRMCTCVHRFVLLLFAFGAFGSAWAASEDRLPAVWNTQELTFSYVGFTSRYSCEGLRDKVEQALITLGARRDLIVTPHPCAGLGKPEPFPRVQIKVSTLKPAAEASADGTVEAHWKTVSLAGIDKLRPGDCELAEQIRREILPLFTTRNVKMRTDCVPHQEPAGNIVLTVDVLVPTTD